MDITELNGGCTPCALSLNDSTLSFPSMDGLIWINPTASAEPLPGDIYIDEASADGEALNTASLVKPTLPPNTRELVFHLGFPAWAGPENLYIEYKLEPYSDDAFEALKLECTKMPSIELNGDDFHSLTTLLLDGHKIQINVPRDTLKKDMIHLGIRSRRKTRRFG